MKTIFSLLKLTVFTLILFAVIYPLAIYGIAKLAPNQGKGETISVNGKVVGYQKIGQKFDKSNYFWEDLLPLIIMLPEVPEVTKVQVMLNI